MARSRLLLAGWLAALGAVALAQQKPTPTFRAGVDVVQLDVSVLDKDHQPVKGLTEQDFTILEDGKPQPIVVFNPVDLPDVVTAKPTAGWMKAVSPDITTNTTEGRRLVMIVMDDATIIQPDTSPGPIHEALCLRKCSKPPDMWAVNAVRTSAHSAIDRLGPDDLATVIFTGDNRQPQDFTNDHAKLHAAAEKFGIGFDPSCIYYQHTIQTLTSIADYMAGLNQRRKAIMYISGGVPVDVGSNRLMVLVPDALPKECGTRLVDMMKDVFREAQKSNVAIYTIDPFGLRVDAHLDNYVGAQVAFLQTMAENTGGRAIVNTNDFERGLTQIFRENSAYYLVGYSPTNVKADGTFRRIEVKVDRPGVEVNTRKNYYAPAAEKPGDKPKPVPSPLQKAMGDVLPNADVPLQVTLAPFALPDPSTGLGAGGKTAAVAIALGVARPKDRMAARADDVDVVVKAFTPDGTERGTIHDTPHVSFMGASDGPLQFEVMSRIDLPPGPYEIRVSAHSAARDTTGSVYADVIVPDFAKEPLSLSGVALGLMPSPVAASRDALASLLPLVPTSQREFYRSDRVTAFLRVYEGGKSSIAPATIHTHIIDAHDATMFDDTTTIAATDFDAPTRAADDRFHVPIAKLAPGAYVLTFEAASGKNTARRDVRFSVK